MLVFRESVRMGSSEEIAAVPSLIKKIQSIEFNPI